MSNNIIIVEGNLLDTNANIICHQVNNCGAMNSGVAKQIREKWPSVYNVYKEAFDKGQLHLGLAQVILIENNQYVVNLVGQDKFGYDGEQYTDYDAFKKGLYAIRNFMIKEKLDTIAFPYNIGCCRGGGKWEVVYNIIKDVFSDIISISNKHKVFIYKLDLG